MIGVAHRRWVAVAIVFTAINAEAGGENRSVALSGQASAGDTGEYFSTFSLPVLTATGHVGFVADLMGSSSLQGVFAEGFGGGGALRAIVRQGEDSGDGTFEGSSNVVMFGREPENTHVAFNVTYTGSSSVAGVYTADHSYNSIGMRSAARTNYLVDPHEDYLIETLEAPVLAGSPWGGGASYFISTVVDITDNIAHPAILRESGGNLHFAQRANFWLDNEGVSGRYTSITDLSASFNEYYDGETYAYVADVTNGYSNWGETPEGDYSGVFAFDYDGHTITRVDQNAGDPSISFGAPVVRAHSTELPALQLAYRYFNSDDGSQQIRVWNRGGNGPEIVVATGNVAPDANGKFLNFGDPDMNDNGMLAFHANLNDTDGGGNDSQGLFRGHAADDLTTVVRTGQNVDGLTFMDLSAPVTNNGGILLFKSSVHDGVGLLNGLFLSDGTDFLNVVKQGDALNGSFVLSADSVLEPDRGGNSAFNDYGQVAYRATLLDGRQGVYVYTPHIEYRGGETGEFSNPADWTLGIKPGHPHSVSIAPEAGDVRVAWSTETTISNLKIAPAPGATAEVVQTSVDQNNWNILRIENLLEIHEDGLLRIGDDTQSECCVEVYVNEISLQGGAFLVGENGYASAGSLRGFGTVAGLSVWAGEIVAEGGVLAWETLWAPGNDIRVEAGAEMVFSSTVGERIDLSGTIELNGGDLTAASGLVMGNDGDRLAGHGTVAAAFEGGSETRIEATGGTLTIGDSEKFSGFSTAGEIVVLDDAELHLQSRIKSANLGRLTRLEGGTLISDAGIFLPGVGTITGHGEVQSRVAAQLGSAIVAEGDLRLGNANAYDGFYSDGLLIVGNNTVVIDDRDKAVVGSLTEIGNEVEGGTLAAPNGLLVEFGKTISGYGTVVGSILNNGLINGEGPDFSNYLDLQGTVSGVGDFAGTVAFSGGFSPGLSPTIVNSSGNLIFDSALEIEIGGYTPGTEHDQIIAAGFVALNGPLDVLLIDGFTPSLGDLFTIIMAEQIVGDFAVASFPALGGDLAWALQKELNGIGSDYYRLAVVAASAVPLPPGIWLLVSGFIMLVFPKKRATMNPACENSCPVNRNDGFVAQGSLVCG